MIFDPRNNGNISKDEVILRPNVFTSLNQSKSIKNRCQVGFRFKDFWCRFCFHLPFQLASQIQPKSFKNRCQDACPCWLRFLIWYGHRTHLNVFQHLSWEKMSPRTTWMFPFPKIDPSLLHVFSKKSCTPESILKHIVFVRRYLHTDLDGFSIFVSLYVGVDVQDSAFAPTSRHKVRRGGIFHRFFNDFDWL